MKRLSPVEASDPKADGFLRYEEVIELLGAGYSMPYERGNGNICVVHLHAGRVREDTLRRLMEDGWLLGYANGGGWWLSDEGKKAYLRSTDEMGDGKLKAPILER
jgi:hypothetical protein